VPKPALTARTVLYVEDEETDLFFMQTAFQLEGLGPALRTVGSGRDAINYLAGHGAFADRESYPLPAVVLLDLNLPLVSGFAVLSWIREQDEFRALPVVIFSSSSHESDKANARELRADEYWVKPRSPQLFRAVVKELRDKWLTPLH
jgi:CheY-like chemotaxis protein